MWSCIKDVHKSLLKGDISVTKLCNIAFDQVEATKNLNAFITTRKNFALEEAKTLDSLLQNNVEFKIPSMLFGIPISLKDNFCMDQHLTTCGSKMLHNFVAPYDATVVKKLKDSYCIITGKTNMDEFAMGSSSTTSYFKSAANYWNRKLLNGLTPDKCDPKNWFMAGGSSTGSAISVASGACFASIGTDTGGSTRQPASLTGIVGFKPTYGLISRFGLIPLANCLDVVSLLARNVEDVEIVFDSVIGQDENDLTSVDHRAALKRPKIAFDKSNNHKLRIGIPEEFVGKGQLSADVSSHYSQLIKSLSSGSLDKNGVRFEVVNVKLPNANLATECYTIISSAEIASNMSCYDGVKYGFSTPFDDKNNKLFDRDEFFRANRDAAFGSEVKKRILLGNYFLLSENRQTYLQQAYKLRRLISDDFDKVFKSNRIDVILLPSTPTTSISHLEWLSKQSENKLFGEDYYLIPANLANVPSISLPSGMSPENLPFGCQLVADRFGDKDLLAISRYFEKEIFNSF